MSDLVLEAHDLKVEFAGRKGKRIAAVDGVSIHVRRGEMLALVGESGSGKTTTAHAVLQLLDRRHVNFSGRIVFEGRDITYARGRILRELRGAMQLVYQDPYDALDPRLRVEALVEEPLRVHRSLGSRAERRREALGAIERVGLHPDHARRYPHELSGGERQRVAIASALTLHPTLLVADEPVSMLDMSVRAGILSLLDTIRDDGVAILMITHDLSTAAHYADRIAVMNKGRIVETGPAATVVAQPKHSYTQALMRAVPRLPRDDPDPSPPTSPRP